MSDNRDIYIEKIKAKLDEWNAEIAKLEAKSRLAEADAQARYREKMDALKRARQQVEQDLEKMRQAGKDAWEDFKAGLDRAADALGEALRSAQSRFR